MESPPGKPQTRGSVNRLSFLVQSAVSNLHSLINHKTTSYPLQPAPPRARSPLISSVSTQHPLLLLQSAPFESTELDSGPPTPSSSIEGMPSKPSLESTASVRISGPGSVGKGGPAFVGQVFSMCNLSGTSLMSVSTHFHIPFLSKSTPEWLKKMVDGITKTEKSGPVFRFFMDLGDAVSYVKRMNVPSGVVGACRLDLAYDQFKENPELFQFVPNKKQVKEAKKLLNAMPQKGQKKHLEGVPVFSAQNLDIAIATKDGIKWYTPYFFDKRMLDNILEDSVDQHFDSLIHTRHLERRQDGIDDNVSSELVEEMGDSMWEPPEVLEVIDEIGLPEIPLSVISKAAENQLLDAVDKVLLGNRWLRKAIGVQPKFPYMVDSFERRSISSFQRARKAPNTDAISDSDTQLNFIGSSKEKMDYLPDKQRELKRRNEPHPCAFLPNITMIGVAMREGGQVSKAALKKTVEDLTKELESTEQQIHMGNINDILEHEERDPLFVANVGDHLLNGANAGSATWVRSGGAV
ncbi:unnamed protein product [Cuscuta epithymum]|uniref:Tic22-like family protein n=1 Tax=Cuscuta epithymum TaxID=186058 RepID=A0AAV0FZ25_9ASTE|nr:unnamed protein product [Cuscuta epithymum]